MSEIKINNIPVITENNGSVSLTTDTADIGNNALVVNNNGNVGVGISSPEAKFHVSADGFNGGHGIFQSTNSGNSITIRGVNGAGINDSAFVLFEDGTASRNAFIGLTGDAAGEGALRFATGGFTERMRIDSSGRVTMPYQPAFSVYDNRGENQSDNGEWSRFFTTTVFNIGNCYDISTGRFTAPIAGTYIFGYNNFTTTATSTASRSGIGINGSIHLSMGETVAIANGSTTIAFYLNANDYVSLITQNSNFTAYWYASSLHCRFWGYLIG